MELEGSMAPKTLENPRSSLTNDPVRIRAMSCCYCCSCCRHHVSTNLNYLLKPHRRSIIDLFFNLRFTSDDGRKDRSLTEVVIYRRVVGFVLVSLRENTIVVVVVGVKRGRRNECFRSAVNGRDGVRPAADVVLCVCSRSRCPRFTVGVVAESVRVSCL